MLPEKSWSAIRIRPGYCEDMGVFLWATLLCGYDVCFRRLPDWLTLPAAALALWWQPWCFVGGLLWAVLYLAARVGGGDVKLALSLGTYAAAQGVGMWLGCVALASVFTVALCLVLRRKAVPHGPSMIVSTLLLGGIGFI